MSEPQKYHGNIKWISFDEAAEIGREGLLKYTIHRISKMAPQSFLSRVYDVKYRFEKQSGFVPTQLFLGPAEMLEFYDYVKELERAGLIKQEPCSDRSSSMLAGMTIIALASDGMRAGISSE